MADASDLFRGFTEVTSGGPDEDQADDPPALTEEQFDRRARYLAKAASLGYVVADDETPGGEH
jgi:hypothetical protein